ncbi:hypothetical protein BKA56DRAFT_309960 [Ilyonectria sp. MPI-CAGE-AT-0026]|nr:hypothetical protein BKA56DRAFT_309960 [Ilyonectria sp. MPI-CAGE-AT-0026]
MRLAVVLVAPRPRQTATTGPCSWSSSRRARNERTERTTSSSEHGGGLLSYSNSGESALRPCYYGGSGEHVPVLRNIILLWWFLVWAVCTSSDICSDTSGGNEEPRREMRRQPSRTLQTLMNDQASRLESNTSSCQAAMIQGGLGERVLCSSHTQRTERRDGAGSRFCCQPKGSVPGERASSQETKKETCL